MSAKLRGDEPIRLVDEDLLGRADLAKVIAGEIRNIDSTEGFVVGILGPWGSGKTSLINLVRQELANEPVMPVLDFNPWMFSGADQLVERFFAELASQLGERPQDKLKTLGKEFARYGKMAAPLQRLPIAGPWIGLLSSVPEIAQIFKDYVDAEEGGLSKQRRELNLRLTDLENPILVIIDDIDRLTSPEIRDIFKLVRLTANFTNIVYLVSFDRRRIEVALTEDGICGRDYLEKIIQLPYDIPTMPGTILTRQITTAIDDALAGIDKPGKFDAQRWPGVFLEIIRPLIRNVRDVRRYTAALPGTIKNLGGRVALVDVLALEAVRIFHPDLFAAIEHCQDALTNPEEPFYTRDLQGQVRKAKIENLLEIAKPREKIATELIERVFPAAVSHLRNQSYSTAYVQQWSLEQRVADPHVLGYYLERVAGNRLKGLWEAERVVEVIGKTEEFESFVKSVPADSWEDIFLSLPTYEDRIPLETASLAASNLINQAAKLPRNEQGMFGLDPASAAFLVVYRLIGRLPSVERASAIREVLNDLDLLSDKLSLLHWVGPGEDAPDRTLIDEDAYEEFASALRDEMRKTSADSLAREPNLYLLLHWETETASPGERLVTRGVTKSLGRALFKASVTFDGLKYVRSGAPSPTKEIRWDFLLDQFGTADAILGMIEDCRKIQDDPELAEAITLIQQRVDDLATSVEEHPPASEALVISPE